MTTLALQHHLLSLADPIRAVHSRRFFKTGAGEYGAGDQFLGVTVPVLRAYLKQCPKLELAEIQPLLYAEFHEIRLFALLMLVRDFQCGDQDSAIYQFYLQHIQQVNNWDLVDSSASYIVGAHLFTRDRSLLTQFAHNESLWIRRIAIVATWHFIRQNQFDDTLRIATLLLHDHEDLMHKATGWMLREVGKRDVAVLQAFLQQHYSIMPRTMLRYAIEKFPEALRQQYLRGEVV